MKKKILKFIMFFIILPILLIVSFYFYKDHEDDGIKFTDKQNFKNEDKSDILVFGDDNVDGSEITFLDYKNNISKKIFIKEKIIEKRNQNNWIFINSFSKKIALINFNMHDLKIIDDDGNINYIAQLKDSYGRTFGASDTKRFYYAIDSFVWSPDGEKVALKVQKYQGPLFCIDFPFGAGCKKSIKWSKIIILDIKNSTKEVFSIPYKYSRLFSENYGSDYIFFDWIKKDEIYFSRTSLNVNFGKGYITTAGKGSGTKDQYTDIYLPDCLNYYAFYRYSSSTIKLNLISKKFTKFNLKDEFQIFKLTQKIIDENKINKKDIKISCRDDKNVFVRLDGQEDIPIPKLPQYYYIYNIENNKLDLIKEFVPKKGEDNIQLVDFLPDIGFIFNKPDKIYLYENNYNNFIMQEHYFVFDFNSGQIFELPIQNKNALFYLGN